MFDDLMSETKPVTAKNATKSLVGVDPERMFGEPQYQSITCSTAAHFELLARVLAEMFVGPVTGYEELLQGLMSFVDELDNQKNRSTDTVEELEKIHDVFLLDIDEHEVNTWLLRAKIGVMLTFFMTEFVFGCERFFYKWSCMIHTFNVFMHGTEDYMIRPEPPQLHVPTFLAAHSEFNIGFEEEESKKEHVKL